VSPFLTHRHPHFWEKPEQFHPEHFRPESVAQRAPFAYLPFSGGPRTCIGATLATVETKIILATLAQRFKLSLVADHPVALQPVITLRPQHGLLMRIEESVGSDLGRQSVP
jgi:cytochrome P450